MSFATPAGRRLVTLVGGVAVTAALATGLASCGSAGGHTAAPAASSTPLAGLAPDQAVKTAFQNLGRATTVHTQLRLATSPGAAASMTNGSDPLTPAQAALLRGGSLDLTVTAPQGEDVAQVMTAQPSHGKSAAAVDVTLNGGQGPLAAIRSVGGNLYGMVSLPQLSQLTGKDLSKAATSLGTQNPNLAPIVSAVVAGKWLEVSSDALTTYGRILGQGTSSSALGAGIAADVRSAFTKDVTWKAGATAGTYDASLQARPFVADLYPDLARVSRLSGSPLPSKQALLGQIPAGTTLSAEVATASDQVSSVTVDLLQLDHDPADLKKLGPHPKVDLVARFDTTTAPVVAPADAVVLDRQIPSLLMDLGGLSSGSGV